MSAISSVNLIAVVVAAVVSFVSGGIYWGVLAIFLNYADAQNALAGAAFALLTWIGFVITISIGQAAFGQISWTQFIVNAGESLLGYVLMGAIIGAWA